MFIFTWLLQLDTLVNKPGFCACVWCGFLQKIIPQCKLNGSTCTQNNRGTIQCQEKWHQFIIKTETNAGMYTSFPISQLTTTYNENINKINYLLLYLTLQ